VTGNWVQRGGKGRQIGAQWAAGSRRSVLPEPERPRDRLGNFNLEDLENRYEPDD